MATLAAARAAAQSPPMVWDDANGHPALYDPERAQEGAWIIRRCQLKGMAGAYEFSATGTGLWSGVMLAFGRPRDEETDGPATLRVRVMLGSELLWRHAVKGGTAYTSMRAILDALALDGQPVQQVLVSAPPDDAVRPSRIDVCRDHFGYDWTRADLDNFACRQRNRGGVETYEPEIEWDRPDETSTYCGASTATYYVGRRGARARFFRVYDKTEEAATSGKLPWLEPLWEMFGWKRGMRMWRAEIEHGSEFLAEHGCHTLADVIGFEFAAWRRYTRDVRHTLHDLVNTDRRGERAPTSAVWECLADVDPEEYEPAAWRWTSRPPSQGYDKAMLAKQAAGCAAKLAPLFEIASAEDHPALKGLPATAKVPAEVRQEILDFLEPLIAEALLKQARAALNAAMDERERRHLPKDDNHD